ncbi:MAG: hypothetical protein JST85_00180 [Acidobacteria bacterium]|nr:hypothetical protein [Acidobacteriota bacterium]
MDRTRSTSSVFMASILLLTFLLSVGAVQAQNTAFTYQGKLTDAGNPANGNYDLQFKLFDTVTVGTGAQQGATIVRNSVAASAGVFTVTLDFGANVFGGADRYLEIGVRPSGSAVAYTILAPRQQITSTPYAIQTLNAQQLGGLPANRYLATNASGNVGIGTTTPTSKLEIAAQDGLAITGFQPYLTLRDTNAGGARSILASGNGDFGFYPNSFIGGTPAVVIKNGTGNVGIGESNPLQKLHLSGQNTGLRLQSTQPDIWTTTQYVTSAREWHTGVGGPTVTNGVQNKYYVVDLTAGQFRMAIDTNGNVGIGTTNPSAKLQVEGGASAGVLANSQGNAVIGYSSAPGFAAVYGENISNSTGYGVYGKGTSGYAMYAEGNAGQSRNKGGLVKAMIYVDPFLPASQYIVRCYNGITNSSTGNCGFSMVRDFIGTYRINFGFQISDRFFSLSLSNAGITGAIFVNATNEIGISTYDVSSGDNAQHTDSRFYVLVY